MERNGFFVIKIAMAILFGMAVAILPLQAEDKEKIDQKKPILAKWQRKHLPVYIRQSHQQNRILPTLQVTLFLAALV